MDGTKEGVGADVMSAVLNVLLDSSNYPLLIHCKHGKVSDTMITRGNCTLTSNQHRTGCAVGAMRKVESWDTSRILQEYSAIAAPKIRECDVKYLTELDTNTLCPI